MSLQKEFTPEAFLISLLRTEVFSNTDRLIIPGNLTLAFWKQFHAILVREGLEPFAYRILLELQDQLIVPDRLSRILFEAAVSTQIRNRMRLEWFHRISQIFEEQGIAFVPLKGLALAPTVYALKGDRSFNDLDILVSVRDLNNASRILENFGFKMDPFRSKWGHLPASYLHHHLPPFRMNFTTLELHYKLLPGNSEGISRSMIETREYTTGAKGIPVPEKAHHLLFLAAHWHKHAQNGQSQLRLIRDLALLAGFERISWDAVFALASRFGFLNSLHHARSAFEKIYLDDHNEQIPVYQATVSTRSHLFQSLACLPTLRLKWLWILDLLIPSKEYIAHYHPGWTRKSICLWHLNRIFRWMAKMIKKKAVARLSKIIC